MHVSTANDLYIAVKKLTDDSVASKTTVQPIICVVGTDLSDIQDFYVYYFNTYYKLPNIMKSIDVCFKIFHVFNLKYPLECSAVWNLIQKYIYDIHTDYDEKTALLETLIADLKQ